MKCVNSLVAVALALGCSTVHAGLLINPGFETGNLTGWSTSLWGGGANVVPSFLNPPPAVVDANNPYIPYLHPSPGFGSYFLKMSTGTQITSVGRWQTVTQSFDIKAGQTLTLTGAAAFAWGDQFPYQDGARVTIIGATQTWEEFSWSGDKFIGSEADGFANGSWKEWDWTRTATADEQFTLEYAVINTSPLNNPNYPPDASGSSYGLFDIKVSAVPEPVSLALYVIGLASLSGMRRRRTVSQCRSA